MGRNDYRDGRRQRNVVLDVGLDDRVRLAAAGCGVSVNRFIVDVLEREVVGVGVGGGVRPDWEAIVAAGRRREPVYLVDAVVVDPLEEIA